MQRTLPSRKILHCSMAQTIAAPHCRANSPDIRANTITSTDMRPSERHPVARTGRRAQQGKEKGATDRLEPTHRATARNQEN